MFYTVRPGWAYIGWPRLGHIQKARIIFPEILREVSLVISELQLQLWLQ